MTAIDILEWQKLRTELAHLKQKEAEMRQDICESILADTPMKNGRATARAVIDGHKLKAVQALNYRIDGEVLDTIRPHLSDTEKLAIRYKPELALAVYKKLPEDSLLNEAITTSDAMPTLTVED